MLQGKLINFAELADGLELNVPNFDYGGISSVSERRY
jgi:hypothetical protein